MENDELGAYLLIGYGLKVVLDTRFWIWSALWKLWRHHVFNVAGY